MRISHGGSRVHAKKPEANDRRGSDTFFMQPTKDHDTKWFGRERIFVYNQLSGRDRAKTESLQSIMDPNSN
jgi:hypothetical protein